MYSKEVHAWFLGAPKRKQRESESIPRVHASRDAPIEVTIDQFIRAYHVLTDDEKERAMGKFHYNQWKSSIRLIDSYDTFPDISKVPAPNVDVLLQSLLLILDSYDGRSLALDPVIQIETLLQGVELTAKRVASMIELYLLDGKHRKAIELLQSHNVARISRKRLERACKEDADFMLPNVPLFVQKDAILAKDAIALCIKFQKKNENAAKQLITHQSIDPWMYLGDALSYKMFSLADAIVTMSKPTTQTYAIESRHMVKLLKYPRCDAIVHALCREPCFLPSRFTIAIELYKVPRYRGLANALIPLNHPQSFEYLKETKQLNHIDIDTMVQKANQTTGSVHDIPQEKIREALAHGLDQTKVTLDQLFAYMPLNEIDYGKIINAFGTESVITHIQSPIAWVGFLRAPFKMSTTVIETLVHRLPISLFTKQLLHQCCKGVNAYTWMSKVILRAAAETAHILDGFIQQYPRDIDVYYSLNDVLSCKNIQFDGLTRLTQGGVLHASMFPSVAEYGLHETMDINNIEFTRWCVETLGLSVYDVYESANKSQNKIMIKTLKQMYPTLENDDLLEHINLQSESFLEIKDSYIVDLWHVRQSDEKPTEGLHLRNHYTWFNPSFNDAYLRRMGGTFDQMLNTYMPEGDDAKTNTMWVKRIRVNIRPLVWFNHKRASDLDDDRRSILSNVFARYDSNGRMFGYREYEAKDQIQQRTTLYMNDNVALEKRLHKFDAYEFDCLRVDQNFICSNVHDMLQMSDYDAVLSYDVTDGEPDTKSIILFDVQSVLVCEWDWTIV